MNQPPPWEQYQARLASYAHAQVNYDFSRQSEYNAANGWRLDDYTTDLPAEAPGPPAAHGAFAAAQEVLRRYAFPPPSLITGIFRPDAPLAHRVMLLRARFLGFSFWFGVRVGEVTDEAARPTPGGPERVWGYGYRTLQGHFERGQIDFTLHTMEDGTQVSTQERVCKGTTASNRYSQSMLTRDRRTSACHESTYGR